MSDINAIISELEAKVASDRADLDALLEAQAKIKGEIKTLRAEVDKGERLLRATVPKTRKRQAAAEVPDTPPAEEVVEPDFESEVAPAETPAPAFRPE